MGSLPDVAISYVSFGSRDRLEVQRGFLEHGVYVKRKANAPFESVFRGVDICDPVLAEFVFNLRLHLSSRSLVVRLLSR